MGLYEDARASLRERALTFVAADTGVVSLGATPVGFSRAAGSFLTDGFRPNMELASSGFPSPASGTFRVKAVSANLLEVTDASTLSTIVAAAGRRLMVPWLAMRSLENHDLTPDPSRPYLREKLVPQEHVRQTIGPYARVQAGGTWLVDFFFPSDVRGTAGPEAYVDSVLETLFFPGLSLARNGQTTTIVTSFRSAGRPSAGWYMIPLVVRFKTYFITPQ